MDEERRERERDEARRLITRGSASAENTRWIGNPKRGRPPPFSLQRSPHLLATLRCSCSEPIGQALPEV